MNMIFGKPIRILLIIFYCLCFTTFSCWSLDDRFPVDGDEQHYLIIANGISKHRTFEQTLPYLEEFKTRKIYSPGLAARDAVPTAKNTRGIEGPHGLYNIHSVGLPLLIAIPFKLAGTSGAKVFLILLSGLAVLSCWAVSGLFTSDTKFSSLSVAAVTIGLPLIPAANQIYPDIPAGLIALTTITSLLYEKRNGSHTYAVVLCNVLAISYLPWLHIKFSAAALLLTLTVFWLKIRNHWTVAKSLTLAVPLCVSFLGIVLYNFYAFSSPSGPYQGNALEISSHSLMVFVGLYVDQFQGMLLQNPALIAGILFAAPFLKQNFLIGITTLAVHLSFVVPNALHPNWYGGYSFAGRFGWSGALVLMPVAVFGLVETCKYLRSKSYYLFFLLFLIQANAYIRYTFENADLYNVSRAWPEKYPSFIPELKGYTPLLYDNSWAYSYLPNIVFVFLLVSFLVTGLTFSLRTYEKISYRHLLSLLAAFSLLVMGGGLASSYPAKVSYEGASLPSVIGTAEDNCMSAAEGHNSVGFLTFGPYLELPQGRYKFILQYNGSNPKSSPLGWWDVSSVSIDKPIATGELLSSNKTSTLEVKFEVPEQLADSSFEMRTFWNGEGQLSVDSVSLEKM